jgi:hypothetical protein
LPVREGPFTKGLRDTTHLRGVLNVAREADKSTEWLRDQVVKLAHGELDLKKAPTSRRANKVGDGMTNRLRLGSMYMNIYAPKHAKTLPYYDTFPLIIPIRYYDNGYLAINLHYLPPAYRAAMLDKLFEIFEGRGMTDVAKYKLTLTMLDYLRSMPEFAPCVKRYLSAHVRSLFQPVPPEDWHYTVLLNSENFVKASKQQVWSDSLKKMGIAE